MFCQKKVREKAKWMKNQKIKRIMSNSGKGSLLKKFKN